MIPIRKSGVERRGVIFPRLDKQVTLAPVNLRSVKIPCQLESLEMRQCRQFHFRAS
jgi:hypothetical protein